MKRIDVDLGDRSYPVLVGPGARHRLLDVLPTGTARVAVVTTDPIAAAVQVDPGVPSETLVIEEGEAVKTLETVEELCRQFAAMGLARRDCVVAVGGGLVTDLVGFAAAIYHRGTPVVHVPTTLLAQVDASIGGKTGVNLPEGKNLLGAYWQPAAVLCDTSVLETLPEREYRSGTGEMAKYHFIASRFYMDATGLPDMALADRVAFCVELKAKAVSGDERDDGLRLLLNYGHTVAHALEIAGQFDLRHGEAVAIGLHAAARLAQRLGRIDEARVGRHLDVLRLYGLPTQVPAGADIDRIIALAAGDKKRVSADGLTFVLDGADGVEPVTGIKPTDLLAVLAELQEAS